MKHPFYLLFIPLCIVLLCTSCNPDAGPYAGKWKNYKIITSYVEPFHPGDLEFFDDGTVDYSFFGNFYTQMTFVYFGDSLITSETGTDAVFKYRSYFPHPDTMYLYTDMSYWTGSGNSVPAEFHYYKL